MTAKHPTINGRTYMTPTKFKQIKLLLTFVLGAGIVIWSLMFFTTPSSYCLPPDNFKMIGIGFCVGVLAFLILSTIDINVDGNVLGLVVRAGGPSAIFVLLLIFVVNHKHSEMPDHCREHCQVDVLLPMPSSVPEGGDPLAEAEFKCFDDNNNPCEVINEGEGRRILDGSQNGTLYQIKISCSPNQIGRIEATVPNEKCKGIKWAADTKVSDIDTGTAKLDLRMIATTKYLPNNLSSTVTQRKSSDPTLQDISETMIAPKNLSTKTLEVRK